MKTRARLWSKAVVGLAFLLSAAPLFAGPDWALFQGDTERSGAAKAGPIESPRILWSTKVGVQSWLNSPLIVGDKVIAGSSGRTWNRPDKEDGVYCLGLDSGDIKWFSPAPADINGLAYGQGLIVATGDDGAVRAIEIDSGKTKWTRSGRNKKMYTFPLVLGGLVVAGDSGGVLYCLDLQTGDVKWTVEMEGAIRGGACSDGWFIYAASTGGEVVSLRKDGTLRWRESVKRPSYSLFHKEGPGGGDILAEIYAAPTLAGELLIVPFARDTYYDTPAMYALHKRTGRLAWRATNPLGVQDSFGNLRSSPALYKDMIVYGEPYSNRLVGITRHNGEAAFSVAAGFCAFPHYPSPAVLGNQAILPRHDGGLYAIDLEKKELSWSLYLGDREKAGEAFPNVMPSGWEHCAWAPDTGSSFFASPAAGGGKVVVGTEEGYLYCIGD